MIHSRPAGAEGAAQFDSPAAIAEAIIETVGKTVMLALPLGLGKANHIANALYARAVADRSIRLSIFTALTLEKPRAANDLERRFFDPVAQRVFGGYPALDYAAAMRAGTLPRNVEINEFFFAAGRWLGSPYAQQHYICANYTHALRYVLDRGVNVVAQLGGASARLRTASLQPEPAIPTSRSICWRCGAAAAPTSCLPARPIRSLPYMPGDAAIEAGEFDLMLDGPATDFALFAPPRAPVSLTDYAAGLHAASLVADGGTLQIGIGALGDAVAHGLILRHRNNDKFRELLTRLGYDCARDGAVRTEPFDIGLYGCTEMFVEGMLDLFRAGILKREVDGAVLHAGFFLGSRAFNRALREMPIEMAKKFGMTSVSYVNELYGDEDNKRRARKDARFLNDAMMATLLGDVVSDGLDDGRIVSGVGGQYNFIAQGFALEGARSALMLHATRTARRKTQTNIRWRYAHTTIPRHLRDIIVTEYGIADIRGQTDRDVIAAMLAIADARFQDELLREAKDAGKIERSFVLPDGARDNTPDAIERILRPAADAGLLPAFPFGTEFTEVEQSLLPALETIRSASPRRLPGLLLRGLTARSGQYDDSLARLGLAQPKNPAEWLYAGLVRGALRSTASG